MRRSYRELLVWQKAKGLAVDVYKHTEHFSKTETYGLTSQIRRAAVSVVSNIAEGQGRLTQGEFQQFLGHSRGSLLGLDTQLAIARVLGYLDKESHQMLDQRAYQVLGLLNRPLDSLRNSNRVNPETLKP